LETIRVNKGRTMHAIRMTTALAAAMIMHYPDDLTGKDMK
jgi:hypothetical protein